MGAFVLLLLSLTCSLYHSFSEVSSVHGSWFGMGPEQKPDPTVCYPLPGTGTRNYHRFQYKKHFKDIKCEDFKWLWREVRPHAMFHGGPDLKKNVRKDMRTLVDVEKTRIRPKHVPVELALRSKNRAFLHALLETGAPMSMGQVYRAKRLGAQVSWRRWLRWKLGKRWQKMKKMGRKFKKVGGKVWDLGPDVADVIGGACEILAAVGYAAATD